MNCFSSSFLGWLFFFFLVLFVLPTIRPLNSPEEFFLPFLLLVATPPPSSDGLNQSDKKLYREESNRMCFLEENLNTRKIFLNHSGENWITHDVAHLLLLNAVRRSFSKWKEKGAGMTSDGFPRMVASCDNLPNRMWRDLILCVRVLTLSVDWSIQHPVGGGG